MSDAVLTGKKIEAHTDLIKECIEGCSVWKVRGKSAVKSPKRGARQPKEE